MTRASGAGEVGAGARHRLKSPAVVPVDKAAVTGPWVKEKVPHVSVAPGSARAGWEGVMPSASGPRETREEGRRRCFQLPSGSARLSLPASAHLSGMCRSKSTGLQVSTPERQHSPRVYSADTLTFS